MTDVHQPCSRSIFQPAFLPLPFFPSFSASTHLDPMCCCWWASRHKPLLNWVKGGSWSWLKGRSTAEDWKLILPGVNLYQVWQPFFSRGSRTVMNKSTFTHRRRMSLRIHMKMLQKKKEKKWSNSTDWQNTSAEICFECVVIYVVINHYMHPGNSGMERFYANEYICAIIQLTGNYQGCLIKE